MPRDARQGVASDARQFCQAVSKGGRLSPGMQVKLAHLSGSDEVSASLAMGRMDVDLRFTLTSNGRYDVKSLVVWTGDGTRDNYNLVPVMDRLDDPDTASWLDALIHDMRDLVLCWLVLQPSK